MNLDEYQRAAERTMAKGDPSQGPGGADFNLRQAVWGLGLTGEAAEVAGLYLDPEINPATLTKEVGDVLWYIAAFCTHNRWSMAHVMNVGFDVTLRDYQRSFSSTAFAAGSAWGLHLAKECGAVADYIKKVVGHGHVLDEARLRKGLNACMIVVTGLCTAHGLDLDAVCEANIAKLNKRYKDGFSTEASVNRAPGDV